MMVATLSFAFMNICIKKLTALPPIEIVFFRCSIALFIAYVLLKRAKEDWIGSHRKLLVLRGLFGTLALYTFFITLQTMSLASAVTIQYMSPIFTTIIATLLFKDKTHPVQYLFFAISFLGVILLKGFDETITLRLLLIGLVSAICSGFAYNFVRTLKEKEHPLVVVLHFQLIGAIIGGVFSIFVWKMPVGIEWGFVILTGVFTHFGQLHLTKALQREAVGIVSSVNYLGVFYAFIFGILIFNEAYEWANIASVSLVLLGVFLSIIFKEKNTSLL